MVLVNTVNAETQRVRESGAGCAARREGQWKSMGVMYRGFIVCRKIVRASERASAHGVPSRKRRTGKGSGIGIKGCFNSLLSSVAQQEGRKSNAAGSQLFSGLAKNESERERETVCLMGQHEENNDKETTSKAEG